MNLVAKIEETQVKKKTASFNPGDQVRVHVRIKEGEKDRVQVFEGTVISKRHGGNRTTFCVRKISYGIGVERIFPLHAPNIEKIKVMRKGKVRRAKLYYLRKKRGKAARIKEKKMVG